MNDNSELMKWALGNITEKQWPDEKDFLFYGPENYWKIFFGDETVDDDMSFLSYSCYGHNWIPFEGEGCDEIHLSHNSFITKKDFLEEKRKMNQKSELFGKKYRVNPKTSELLQKAVFQAGGRWISGNTSVKYTEGTLLVVSEEGRMLRIPSEFDFNADPSPEAEIEVVKSIEITSVENPKKKALEEKIRAHEKLLGELKKELEKL